MGIMYKQINSAIALLELSYPLLSVLKQARSREAVLNIEKEFKGLVRKQKKTLAKKYHPDYYKGGDEKMKLINAGVDFLLGLKIEFRLPVVPVFRPVYYQYWYTSSTDTATSTNCW